MRSRHRLAVVLIGVCLVTVAGTASTSWAGFDENLSVSADKLVLRNLIGEITVEGHAGSDFEIEARVQGADATPERVRFETDGGQNAEVVIHFPLDESKRFVYPRIHGNTSFSLDDGGSWLASLFGSGNVKVSGSGRGLEIWVDVTVKVPNGKSIVIDHGVGEVTATNLDGEIELSTRSGSIEASDVRGSLTVDTGSGHVSVARVEGNVSVDTGSGHVEVRDVHGDKLHVDTGSGAVELEAVDSASVHVDTGSGGVEGERVGADDLMIDTGSGAVRLELERMGTGRFEIDTGSGGIDLELPADASAAVSADSGNGGIRIDLADGYRIHKQEDDEAELTVGGGAARVSLDTGSGTIRISQ